MFNNPLQHDTALIKEALEGITQALLIIDDDLNIVFVNSRFIETFDLPHAVVERGAPVENMHRYLARRGEYGPGDPEEHVRFRQNAILSRQQYKLDRKRAGGSYIEVTGNPLPSGGYVFTFTDVTERRLAQQYLEQQVACRTESLSAANQELSRLADLDPLLGIFNRRKFYELVGTERSRYNPCHANTAVMMIDVDHFKAVNDQYGHSVGDATLKAISAALVTGLRDGDIVARYGGEEFVVLLPNTRLANAEFVAEKLRQLVAATPISVGRETLYVTVSIGVTAWLTESLTIEDILRHADEALYQAKRAGRNCVFTASIVSNPRPATVSSSR